MAISYKDAGVDIEKGDEFVRRITRLVRSTYSKAVKSGVGGFASLYDVGGGKYLAAGTDGVGTKLKIAQRLGKHDTIGIDLVAMCVNDVICTGARPLFFLDYIGCGRLDLAVSEAIVKGIVDGCRQAGCALVGGETAEMPGMYEDGEYDLAGFSVGEVRKAKLVDGRKLRPGDELVGIASSGVHSNGFSLVRKLIGDGEEALLALSLAPTRIYVKPVLAALDKFSVRGLAHITGSGFLNIPRMSEKLGYRITALPEKPGIYRVLAERSGLGAKELFTTFNMGLGFVLAVKKGQGEKLAAFLRKRGEPALVIGEVIRRPAATVELRCDGISLDLK